MNSLNLDQNQQVILQLFLLGRQIRKQIQHEDPNQMLNEAILLLIAESPQTISSLAQTLAISLSTASEKINKLIKADLVTIQKKQDRRTNHLRLTSKGEKLLAQLLPKFALRSDLVLSGLTNQEKQILLKSLQLIKSNLIKTKRSYYEEN